MDIRGYGYSNVISWKANHQLQGYLQTRTSIKTMSWQKTKLQWRQKKDEQAQTNKTVLQSKWQLQKFSSQLWKQLCRNDINCGGASESGREYVNAITPTRLQCFYWIIIGIIQTCYGQISNLGFQLGCWKGGIQQFIIDNTDISVCILLNINIIQTCFGQSSELGFAAWFLEMFPAFHHL